MKNIWNVQDLQPPPVNRYLAINTNLNIKELRAKTANAISVFSKQDVLHTECTVLTRLIFKMNLAHSKHKSFKYLIKLKRCLRQYLNMDILTSVKVFHDSLPAKNDHETYVPSRQMLLYILVRLQGLAKLLQRAVESAPLCAELCYGYVHLGHSWKFGFAAFGIVSRIQVVCRKFIRDVCDIYKALFGFIYCMEDVGAAWLINSNDLPTDLVAWLHVDWIYTPIELLTEDATKNFNAIFRLGEDSDNEDDDVPNRHCEILECKDDGLYATETIILPTIAEAKKTEKVVPLNCVAFTEEDIGEVVVPLKETERTKKEAEDVGEVVPFKKPKKSRKKKKSLTNIITNISTTDSLSSFMKNETILRIKNLDNCVTRDLNNLQWGKLQNLCNKCIAKSKQPMKCKKYLELFKSTVLSFQ